MEKLTIKRTDNTISVVNLNDENYNIRLYECVRKLFHYEQTELNPEDIDNLKLENEHLKNLFKNISIDVNTFGGRLKMLRREKQVSQRVVADDLGVNAMTIVKWEKGIFEPKLSQIRAIAKYFNVKTSYLIGE